MLCVGFGDYQEIWSLKWRKEHGFARIRDELKKDHGRDKDTSVESIKMEYKRSRCRSALKRSEDVDTKKCSKWSKARSEESAEGFRLETPYFERNEGRRSDDVASLLMMKSKMVKVRFED